MKDHATTPFSISFKIKLIIISCHIFFVSSSLSSITPKSLLNDDSHDITHNNDNGNAGDIVRMLQSRIVGGSMVPSPDKYPFHVQWNGQCSGSVIASDFVLTAGHCNVIDNNEVIINAYKFKNITTDGAQVRAINERYIHPFYNAKNEEYDFLLLHLDSPVTNADDIKIEINDDGLIPVTDQSLKVIGLGSLEYEGPLTDVLREVTVQAESNDFCEYKVNFDRDFQEDIMFCAGVDGGGKDACMGDSGAPIFTFEEGDQSGEVIVGKQVGIVSWGKGCAKPGFPGVYSRISSSYSWINRILCENSVDGCLSPTPSPTPEINEPMPTPQSAPPPTDTIPDGINASVEVKLYIKVSTDTWPRETSWDIKDSSGTILEERLPNYYTEQAKLYVDEVILSSNVQYNFTIYDTSGDGICCSILQGYYTVEIASNGDILVDGNGEFRSEASTQFFVPNIITISPTSSPVQPTTTPTLLPTPETSPIPTTTAPTNQPSMAPVTTSPTTSSPSLAPVTPNPTLTPTTIEPTLAPITPNPTTSEPTPEPTIITSQPTFQPTLKPTLDPTLLPTTPQPTVTPGEPTATPTITPPSPEPTTSVPTPNPTTLNPTTNNPTTAGPTATAVVDSSNPTMLPTPGTTNTPVTGNPTTAGPTPVTTNTPVTGNPTTAGPTISIMDNSINPATTGPTATIVNPTSSPTSKPPTALPTISSSSESNDAVSNTLTGLSITLYGITSSSRKKGRTLQNDNGSEDEILDDDAITVFEDATSEYTKDFYKKNPNLGINDVSSYVYVTSQKNAASNDGVIVVYDQDISYSLADDTLAGGEITANDVISAPFLGNEDVNNYVAYLKQEGNKSGNDVFDDVTNAIVNTGGRQDGSNPIIDDKSTGNTDDGSSFWTTGTIVGVAVGGAVAALLLVGGGVFFANKSSRDEKPISPTSATQGSVWNDIETPESPRHQSNKYSERYDSLDDDTDDKIVGSILISENQQGSFDNDDGFSDSESYEQNSNAFGEVTKEVQMDIHAPPGKLGMIIDKPDDGPNIIHAVKDTSIVADKFEVGDKLIAIDDEDVRFSSSIQVSKLLSKKSSTTRKLTIVRSTTIE